MKPDVSHTTSTLLRVSSIVLIFFFVFFLTTQFSSSTYSPFALFSTATAFFPPLNSSPSLRYPVSLPPLSPPSPPPPAPRPPPPPPPVGAERTGIVDENGVMSEVFEVGEFDPNFIEDLRNLSGGDLRLDDGSVKERVKIEKFKLCDDRMNNYIPCLDNLEQKNRFNSSQKGEKFERHCPGKEKALSCVVPSPKGYKKRIPWPESKDEVWSSNVPHRPVGAKGGQNLIAIKGDKLIFPRDRTQFSQGTDKYLDQISEMVPDIAFGNKTRVVLDIGGGVGSFSVLLTQRNVTTLSIAPKDVDENQIQFALERGVPVMVAAFATRRLLYPSQAFDLIHCWRCGIDWTRDDGILLLEVNRLLRAGGYFVWGAQQEQWKELEDLTTRICWKLLKKGDIAIWQKPLNNSCYLNRESGMNPPLCDASDDPDSVWYVGLKACITKLPENDYGAKVSPWPARVEDPPERLQSIKLDATISRKELYTAETNYWLDVLDGYIRAYHWREDKHRNILDMRAGFGGFAAALQLLQYDTWVLNAVPVSDFNTLPVIYDRGLIGVMHDWCEPFDTYPRSYDLIHAASLFSMEQKRCNFSTIMLEMDRMLRYGGIVYIRDKVSVMDELVDIANALGWVPFLHDTGEGPHAGWKILMGEKRLK
ncbi:hypothetical protein UlMin_035908 [Ulmus minor]